MAEKSSTDSENSQQRITTARYHFRAAGHQSSAEESRDAFQSASCPALGQDHPVFQLHYIGAQTLDKRVTKLMLKWILVEIRKRKGVEKKPGVLLINQGSLKFVDSHDSSDVILEHNVHSISSFTRCQHDRSCFFYLQRNSPDSPLVMFAFICPQEDKMVDIFQSIQKSVRTTDKPDFLKLTSKPHHIFKTFEEFPQVKKMPSKYCFFQPYLLMLLSPFTVSNTDKNTQVRYQGKCHISEKKKSGAFIDQWLLNRQQQKLRDGIVQDVRQRHASDTQTDETQTGRVRTLSAGDERDVVRLDDDESKRRRHSSQTGSIQSSCPSTSSDSISTAGADTADEGGIVVPDAFETQTIQKRRLTLINTDDQNRTMLLQIDDDKMLIISLDRKSIILEKTFKEISYCTQGAKFTDHFGFICYDSRAKHEVRKEQYIMYIFQCASDNVITEVMETLKRAFSTVLKRSQELQSCEFCPMQQYHRLCEDLTYIKDSESAYNCIQNHILNLPVNDYSDLMNKVKSEECETYEEANDVLMTKLRIKCELRQLEHTHGKESDFNIVINRQSKLNALRNRAKKALAFDMFGKNKSQDSDWKPKSSIPSSLNSLPALPDSDTASFSPSPSPTMHISFNIGEGSNGSLASPRSRSHTIAELPGRSMSSEEKQGLFQKLSSVGQSIEEVIRKAEKSHSPLNRHNSRKASVPPNPTQSVLDEDLDLSGSLFVRNKHRRVSSWRRDIFESVVTSPNSNFKTRKSTDKPIKRSMRKEEIKSLWRSAIEQTILLNRMEKENKNLQHHQEEIKKKKLQLDYLEINPCHETVTNRWKSVFAKVKTANQDKAELWNLVIEGVPRSKRGDIWKLMSRQNMSGKRGLDSDEDAKPAEMPSYRELLHGLTPHQHAILIDLGRTFPQHPYFQRQLGAGQLSLFNVLKAYSLVDTEVGYCQGLGFVTGILLMHLEEEDCFNLLCHLMYDLGLRKLYKTNMVGLQIAMYQLARLMRDKYPDLYEHLESLEVTPALYAAPWFITLFSSTFSIGFVARVFDFLLMEGISAIFKVAIAIVATFRDEIIACKSFETVTEQLKTVIPQKGELELQAVFDQFESGDIFKALYTYEVEYQVLQDDIQSMSISDSTDSLSSTQSQTSVGKLKERNTQLVERIAAQAQKLHNQETMIEALQQSHAKLTTQVRDLEQINRKYLSMIEELKQYAPPNLVTLLENKDYPNNNHTNEIKTKSIGGRPRSASEVQPSHF